MTTIKEVTQASALQPRALIVTVYGLYAREARGWMAVSTLIRLLASLDVDEPAVRSSISRLKRRGIVEAERVNGVAGYALSAAAGEMLAEGDRRIFARARADPKDGWLLAVFSVPESERRQRHTLRSRLVWLGFGTVAAGVWVAPAHLASETRDVLVRSELSSYVDLFRADYLAFGDVQTKVSQWWDLAQLLRQYDEFITTHRSVLGKWKRRRAPDESQAFADYMRALTAWRRLPFLDPGLPDEVLPDGWNGSRAADLFFALRDRLAEPAHRHVESVRAMRDGR
ncbi:MAG: PaaX family transcriptional regulator [Nocardioidaceae bacterium]